MSSIALRVGCVGTLLLAACGLDPDVGGSTYALRSIAGIPLPAPYAQNPQFAGRIMSASIVLREDGTGEWRTVTEDSLGGPTHAGTAELTYTQRAGAITISLVCNDMGACIAPPHLVGEVTSGGRAIDFPLSRITRAPLSYERINR